MNLELYKNFIKIVECGTISSAARVLHLPQPTLSNQLKVLEASYNTPLIERYGGRQNIKLTPTGEVFLRKAQQICGILDSLDKEIHGLLSGTAGTLHLGVTPAYPDVLLYKLLLNFSNEYPQVVFNIVEENSNYLLERLRKEEIEIALIRTPTVLASEFTPICSVNEKLMIAFHRKNPLFSEKMEAIPVSALKDVPLAVSRAFTNYITELCRLAGFEPLIRVVASSRATTLMWTDSIDTVAIFVSSEESHSLSPHVYCRPLLGNNVNTKRTFTCLNNRSLSLTAQSFANFIQTQIDTTIE